MLYDKKDMRINFKREASYSSKKHAHDIAAIRGRPDNRLHLEAISSVCQSYFCGVFDTGLLFASGGSITDVGLIRSDGREVYSPKGSLRGYFGTIINGSVVAEDYISLEEHNPFSGKHGGINARLPAYCRSDNSDSIGRHNQS